MGERGLFESVAKMNNHVSNCHGIFKGWGLIKVIKRAKKIKSAPFAPYFMSLEGVCW